MMIPTEAAVISLASRSVLFPRTDQVWFNPPEGQLGHYVALRFSRRLFLSRPSHSLNSHSRLSFYCLPSSLRGYGSIYLSDGERFFPDVRRTASHPRFKKGEKSNVIKKRTNKQILLPLVAVRRMYSDPQRARVAFRLASIKTVAELFTKVS